MPKRRAHAETPGTTRLASHLGSHHVSRLIYGAIIGLALIVALEDHPPAAGVVAATLTGTAIVVALAELYSEAIGTRLRTHQHISRADRGALAEGAAAVAIGIAIPSVYFVLAGLGAMETETAFTVARWSGLGLIGLYGFWAARLTGTGVSRSVLHALAVGGLGGVLIALKALLH